MSKILDSVWFDNIGIVKTFNGYETKWYIGMGQGHNKELDEKRIALGGMSVVPKQLVKFFKSLRDEEEEAKAVLEKERIEKLKEQIKKEKE